MTSNVHKLQYTRPISEEKKQELLITGMNLCTHLLFVDMFFAGKIGQYIYEAKEIAKELDIYKYDIKKCINQIDEAGKKLMVDFRACERIRVMPTLAYTLNTFVNEYRDFGRLTQRIQYGLDNMTKQKQFILWNCIDNWTKNVEFPDNQKAFWSKIMLIDILLASTASFEDVISEQIKRKVSPKARIDENLRYVQHLFAGMKHNTEALYNKYLKKRADVEKAQYWRDQSSQAQINLNIALVSEKAMDLANGQLYMLLKDYSMWWFARVVSELREKNAAHIPIEIDEDIHKCIKGKPLVYGRLKRTLLSLAKKCKETDILDLQDEIFDNYATKDVDYFIQRALTHNLDPEEADKIMEMVMERSNQKILTL